MNKFFFISLIGILFAQHSVNAMYALHEAIKNGTLEQIKALLETPNLDINQKNEFGNTPLCLAAKRGRYEVAQLLLNMGAKVDLQGQFDETPLYNAVPEGHMEIVRLLLGRGARINVPRSDGCTPLHEAIGRRKTAIACLLINRGASVDQPTYDDMRTPLHQAALVADQAVVWLLLHKGANLYLKDASGHTSIDVARAKSCYSKFEGRAAVISIINDHIASVEARTEIFTLLCVRVARTGNHSKAQTLTEQNFRYMFQMLKNTARISKSVEPDEPWDVLN